LADDRDTVRGAATAAGGFLWDGGENVYVYSQPGLRIRNIGRNPKVTFFRGDANGGGWSLAANIGVLVDVCVTDSPSFATAVAPGRSSDCELTTTNFGLVRFPTATRISGPSATPPRYASVESSQSNAAVQNTIGAMPSQWPSVPSFWRKRRNSFGHVSALNSSSPCPVETGSASLSVT